MTSGRISDQELNLLRSILEEINQNNGVPPFNNLFFQGLLRQIDPSFALRIPLGQNLSSLVPIEAARVLGSLRQRWAASETGEELVGRLRVEAQERLAPIRSLAPDDLRRRHPILGELAELGGFPFYSEFQAHGWEAVRWGLERAGQGQPAAVVLVAPTGGGKTEIFLLPLVHAVARALARSSSTSTPRFAILYPRLALAQDQLRRVLRYVRSAEKRFHAPNQRIVVGMQFSGIRARRDQTLKNRDDDQIFEGGRFLLLDRCPWCESPQGLVHDQDVVGRSLLQCPRCSEHVCVSLSKEDHVQILPHLMLTTVESVDRMLLDADFRGYISSLHGLVLDEAHLYHGLYGAHVAHLIRRLSEAARQGRREDLLLIVSSATIPDPEEFAAKLLFLGDVPPDALRVVRADQHPQARQGLEVFYFLQAPLAFRERALSTMIQTAMAVGHALLAPQGERMLIFVDTLDLAGRLHRKLGDAERTRRLWEFRTVADRIEFDGERCPRRDPQTCDRIYWRGECWRGIRGGPRCHSSQDVRDQPLSLQKITGITTGSRALAADAVIGTSALEVGIDDPSIQATLHYRPPRTVFDFIQRRGRAGRAPDSVAHTVVVLGQEPSDHFYLFRRHRLISGSYELPLNPDNPVIREIHQALSRARDELLDLSARASDKIEALWRWTMERLRSCPYLIERYAQPLDNIASSRRDEGWSSLQEWIKAEQDAWEKQMGILWTLPELRRQLRSPEAREKLEEIEGAVYAWLEGGLSEEEMRQRMKGFKTWAGEFYNQLIDQGNLSFKNDPGILLEAIRMIEDLIPGGSSEARRSFERGRAWHDFFRELGRLFAKDYTRYIPAEVVRIVSRAMYLLHEGLEHHGCPSDLSAYVPDAYFESAKTFVVESISRRGERQEAVEPLIYLTSLFVPYRTHYRYEDNLTMLDGRTDPRSVRHGKKFASVELRAYVWGPTVSLPGGSGQAVGVRRLRVREVESDENDRVSLCLRCFQAYDLSLSRRGDSCPNCGEKGSLRAGSLYVHRVFTDHGLRPTRDPVPIGRSFDYLPGILLWSCVRGSQVFFRYSEEKPQGMGRRQEEAAFNAWLHRPFYFEIQTRGIRWRVPGLPGPEEDAERLRVLHAAAHLLLRVAAAITGVREDQLGYALDPQEGAVVVWEKFEGGAGLSEVFADTLQRDPAAVYREMVATAACPIYWAERKGKDWQDEEELQRRLSQQFGLPPDDETIRDIVREAAAEARRGEGQPTCSAEDGCPVCIETLECHARRADRADRKMEKASRQKAEELVASLARRIPASEWGREGIPGPVIWADEAKGEYVVLVL